MKNQPQDTVYRFHHLGIPTDCVQRNERYSQAFGMFTADHEGDFRVQFHRFEPTSPLHPLIKTLPHVALQVDDLQAAITGKELLLGPYEPIAGFNVAIINDNGLPIELIETALTPEEVWNNAQNQPDLNTTGLEQPIIEPENRLRAFKLYSTTHLFRIAKAVSVSAIGIQSFLIVLGNTTDYDTNYQFVEHVLKMDTTFSTSTIHYRSLTNPILFHASYGLIILMEMLMAGCCLRGSWALYKHINSDPITFHASKNWAVAGLTIGILIWFLGFEVVGGEWFAMWQSTIWNGLNSAERMVSFLVLTLILLHHRDA